MPQACTNMGIQYLVNAYTERYQQCMLGGLLKNFALKINPPKLFLWSWQRNKFGQVRFVIIAVKIAATFINFLVHA